MSVRCASLCPRRRVSVLWGVAVGDGSGLAEVVGHRARFPPLQIKYLATHPDGDASALALPVPRVAFVPATHVTIEEPMV